MTSMPGHEVAHVEGHLLGLGEEVRRVRRQRQPPDRLHRSQLLGHELRRVEQVDALEHLVRGVREGLDAQLPLRQVPSLDRVGQVAAVEVRIATGRELRLLPDERVHTGVRLPVELHQGRRAVAGDEPEGVHAEALHRPVGRLDAAVGHVPHRVVLRLRVERDEVPERVMRRLGLRYLSIGVRLARMDDVGELDAVLDEEDGHVVADEVEGALVGVELHREAACVTDRVGRTARAQHRREPHEDGRVDAVGQESGHRDRRCRAVTAEDAVRPPPACVDDAFGDALVVEVRDLLAQVMVLQQGGPAFTRLERVVRVAKPRPQAGRQKGPGLGPSTVRGSGGLAGGGHHLGSALVGLRRIRVVRRPSSR